MMTPEEANKLEKQQFRYNRPFDLNVDQYCPPLKRIKSGAIAKHQPKTQNMGTDYWKAQCSFRGLKTSGRIDDLKDLIRSRDKSKDAAIKQEQDRITAVLHAYYDQKELDDEEREWKKSSTTLEWKVGSDAQRALKELLEVRPETRDSCVVVQTSSTALNYWAKKFDLAIETVTPPKSAMSWSSWTVIGRADMVQKQVQKLGLQVDLEAKAARVQAAKATAKADIARAAKLKEKQTKLAALLAEAKKMKDWDLTGSWTVHCDELAEYRDDPPAELTMEIYRDEYRLDDVRDANGMNEDDYYDARYDLTSEEEEGKRQADANIVMDLPHIPRYYARFEFGVVEGTMRIFPPESARTKTATFKVSSNPRFEYVWRGRELGEGEIQTTADEKVLAITFGDHGTTFEGSFECEYVRPVKIVGKKTAHGHGRKGNSREEWLELSERAWNRAGSRRWH